MIGSMIDKYEVLQKIGEGGMATVYRGRHTTLGRDVAIKVLHPHLGRTQRNRARFAREARAIENLDHANILKIFDYSGSEAEDCYIVTEFVDGVTLQELMSQQGRLPSEVAAMVGIELARALGYAHRSGIIHRDIKPENVMVRRDGHIKLMDFGIARFLDEANLTVTGALVGSPAYMSPEQALEHVLDPRSDLFSLGTVLFHAVTGQLPFAGSNPSIILKNIIEGVRPEVSELAPDVSGSLGELIEALLQTSPGDRPGDAEVVEQRLQACLAEVKVDAQDPAWCLYAWLSDPVGYEGRLDQRLRAVLLEEGRGRLAARDHLGALRLFNRLLARDEDNEEVLTLVQSMHEPEPAAEPPRRRWLPTFAALGLAGLGLLVWQLWPAQTSEVVPPPLEGLPPLEAEQAEALLPAPVEAVAAPENAASTPGAPSLPPSRQRVRLTISPPPPPSASPALTPARVSPPPETPSTGTVTVVVPGSWGEIIIDGEPRGRTGRAGEIKLKPGSHQLRVENPMSEPHVSTFEIAPGEVQSFSIPLEPRPSILLFGGGWAEACVVFLDGVERGTVAGLGRRLAIRQPESAHSLAMRCEGDSGPRPVALPARLPPGGSVTLSDP